MRTRRDFLKRGSIIAGITVFFPLLTADGKVKSDSKPNFILILSDDQGWNMTSAKMDPERDNSKSDFFLTPQMERFAEAGMRFSNGYAPSPLCSPSRHAIQFGQTTARLRMVHNPVTPRLNNSVSIPQMLKKENREYKAAHFGKWHIKIKTPEELGYDASDGSTNNGSGYMTSPRVQPVKLDEDPKKIFSISKRSADFMEEQVRSNRPFYLQISHYADHLDVVARKKTVDKYYKMKKGKVHIRPEFAAMNEDLDAGVGMILDKVKELGIKDNTYIIYMADNGARMEHGANFPLKDGKFNIWEGGIRVPFFIIGPGVKPGTICNAPVYGCDLWATIGDLSGSMKKLPVSIDGGSMRELLHNHGMGEVRRNHKGLIFHSPIGKDYHKHFNDPCSTIRLGKYKLFNYWTQDKLVLYDLKADIGEENDISKKYPEKAEEMNKLLMKYLNDVNATFDVLKKVKNKKKDKKKKK